MNAGMALYTALQMLLLAGSMSYGVLVLHRRQVAAGWQLVMLLLGMFFPFHWYMSVSMTKDTVFSAFLLLQLISLTELLLEDRREWRPGVRDLLFFIGTVGMILFRNNGKYAMIVLLAFLFSGSMLWKKSEEALGETVYGKCGSFLYRAFCAVRSVLRNARGTGRQERDAEYADPADGPLHDLPRRSGSTP